MRTLVLAAAIQHARLGRLGKACATLSSSGLAPDNDSTVEKLRQKHPQHLPPTRPLPVEAQPLQLGADFDLLGALTSFSKDVGTDGTNFRVQHLLDAAEAHLPVPFVPRLKAVINLLLKGTAHADIQKHVAGARLIALAKGGDDIRPIAAGNIFRRLASKCACTLLQVRVRSVLGSHQVGVACRGGAEQIVHTMRDKLAQHWESDDFTVLKVDFSNAFNSVSRQSLLDECSELFPELLPWATWCYGSPSLLCYGDSVQLNSCVGVQQGDPLGPLLFCLVLHVLVRKIQADCPDLLLHKWYLDDGALAGSTSVVAGPCRSSDLRAVSLVYISICPNVNFSAVQLATSTSNNLTVFLVEFVFLSDLISAQLLLNFFFWAHPLVMPPFAHNTSTSFETRTRSC